MTVVKKPLNARPVRPVWRLLRLALGGIAGIAIAKVILDEGGIRTHIGKLALENPWIGAAAIIALTVCWGWATLRMLRRTDELDISDHLWSCTLAFCAFCLLVPAWVGLAYLNIAPAPGVWGLYLATMIIAYAGYFYRKFRIWMA